MKRSQLLLLAAALAPEIASPDLLGQTQTLYLLKGAIRPSGSVEPWRSEILRVDEKAGRLSVARDLGTERFAGISFCHVNYEHRVIVLGMPAYRPTTFIAINMDDVQSSLVLKPDFGRPLPMAFEPYQLPRFIGYKPELPTETWVGGASLLFHPGLGLVLSLDLFGPKGSGQYGLPISHGQTNNGLARGLSQQDRAAFTSSGAIGVGYGSASSSQLVSVNDSNVKIRGSGSVQVDTGIPSPPISAAVKGAGRPFWLHTSDSRTVVLQNSVRGADTSKVGDGSSTIYVHPKGSGKWLTPTVPGDAPFVRRVGKFLLGIARTEDRNRERASAGRAEFEELTKNVRWQDGIAASAAHYEASYPGILFAIDVGTGKMFQWRTNQADSEILWADDSAFYYRRANELLRVDLVQGASGTVIGPVSSILKADILLDVHAAFRGK